MKKYRILSFEYCNSIYKRGKRGSFWKEGSGIGYKEWYLLNNLPATIHSVKRLSDGEVFTVGDRIKLSTGTIIKIKHIDFPSRKETKDKIYLHDRKRTSDQLYTKNGEINSVEPIKEPLFTTEDGVDIYEGDEYCGVFLDDLKIRQVVKAVPNSGSFQGSVKYFSTKQEAEQYIEEHKPKYSKADIKEALEESKIATASLFDLPKFKQELNL